MHAASKPALFVMGADALLMVSATFSCDGSHYMPHDEFLAKDTSFWF
jgi:hypothetical protein